MMHNYFKNNFMRSLSMFLLLCVVVISFSGCNDSKLMKNTYRDVKGGTFNSQLVASNSDYELYWEESPGTVLLKSKKTGKVWSDILYDSYKEGSYSANGNSPISITIADIYSLKWETLRSYSEMEENGYCLSKKIKNGIRLTYFFKKYKIAVPVEYVLNDDGVTVSVNTSQILESGENFKLVSVSIASFMCSTVNNKSNYLFVPAGSGALMYTNEHLEGTRKYSGEVYGADSSRQNPEDYTDDEPIHLPVFGAKDTDTAMLGVITSGAGASLIEAQAGNEKLGYSNVCANFFVRGYDAFRFSSSGTGETVATRLTDNIHPQKVSVRYFPLYDDKADYNGMAEKYREYLSENKLLTKSEISKSPYSISFYGGTTVTKSVLGIPVRQLKALTTFSQASDIVKEFCEKTAIAPTIRLMYYGDNGILPGTVIGGKNIPKLYGTKKDLLKLKELCSTNNADMYFDFDVLQFGKSGNGVSKNFDAAKTAIKRNATQYNLSPIRLQLENTPHYILASDKLDNVLTKTIKKAKKYDIDNISLSTLGYIAYSDYSAQEHNLKSGIDEFALKTVKELDKNTKNIATSAANDYIAGIADTIFDVPLKNGNYNAFDEIIPFYQLVYHSYKTLYTTPINISETPDLAIANAAAWGMGLGYDLTATYDNSSNDLLSKKIYGTLYNGKLENISNVLNEKEFSRIYSTVKDSKFVKYEILNNGLTKSVFENGVVIYANNNSAEVDSPVGKIDAFGFILKEEE